MRGERRGLRLPQSRCGLLWLHHFSTGAESTTGSVPGKHDEEQEPPETNQRRIRKSNSGKHRARRLTVNALLPITVPARSALGRDNFFKSLSISGEQDALPAPPCREPLLPGSRSRALRVSLRRTRLPFYRCLRERGRRNRSLLVTSRLSHLPHLRRFSVTRPKLGEKSMKKSLLTLIVLLAGFLFVSFLTVEPGPSAGADGRGMVSTCTHSAVPTGPREEPTAASPFPSGWRNSTGRGESPASCVSMRAGRTGSGD